MSPTSIPGVATSTFLCSTCIDSIISSRSVEARTERADPGVLEPAQHADDRADRDDPAASSSSPTGADPLYSLLAGAIFAVASITDVVDGYLARRWNLVTVVGKFMDPLADKLIAMAALVMVVRLGRIEAWVVILLLGREFIVSGLRTIAASEGMVIAAGAEGKFKNALQLVGIICLCVHYTHPLDFGFVVLPTNFNVVGRMLLYISVAASYWSMVVYFRAFLAMLAARARDMHKVLDGSERGRRSRPPSRAHGPGRPQKEVAAPQHRDAGIAQR